MAVRSLLKIPVYVWIPPAYSPIYKIDVYNKAAQSEEEAYAYDVTDILIEGESTDGVTETIGNFTFTIDNSEETYTNLFKLGDTVRVYMDYATTATTLRFEGVLEKISKTENKLKLSGRSCASFFTGSSITYNDYYYTHRILYDLIIGLNYFGARMGGWDTNVTDSTDTLVYINWYQKPFWECILELCNAAGTDCYISGSGDWWYGSTLHYFLTGTTQNTTECVVHDQNLLETGDFLPDLTNVKNRIIVYGAKIEEQQVLWTSEDETSIIHYGVKEEIINDTSIVDTDQAKARADYELNIKKEPPIIGEITSLMLPTITPAEQIRISDPMNGINPGYYNIQKFTHKFSNDNPMMTVLTIQKETSTLSKILKKRITFESESVEMENPNELRYSWIFEFNTDSGTHETPAKTEITGGVLKLKSGETSGTWISEVKSLTENATKCELRAKVNATGSDYSVSTDNGTNWQSISLNNLLTLSPPGPNLKIKVELNSASTEADSISLLYK
jgi:hypothetical protein